MELRLLAANELAVIGGSSKDPVGARLRDSWIKDSGLWFDEPENIPAAWQVVEPLARQITQRFVEARVQLARQLHADGYESSGLQGVDREEALSFLELAGQPASADPTTVCRHTTSHFHSLPSQLDMLEQVFDSTAYGAH